MSLDRSGQAYLIQSRTSVVADDTTYPSGAGQAGSIAVPVDARGSVTHCLVRAQGSASTVACRVTIYGYNAEAALWYALVQMNDGATLTGTTNTPIADGNNLSVAEAFAHISAFDRLYALIDQTASLAAAGVDIWFMMETP